MTEGAASDRNPTTSQPVAIEGSVFLDGVALGNWVTSHLENEVSGPPNGMTAVDSRMTPTWAGLSTGT
jgi:hypothetical protein